MRSCSTTALLKTKSTAPALRGAIPHSPSCVCIMCCTAPRNNAPFSSHNVLCGTATGLGVTDTEFTFTNFLI